MSVSQRWTREREEAGNWATGVSLPRHLSSYSDSPRSGSTIYLSTFQNTYMKRTHSLSVSSLFCCLLYRCFSCSVCNGTRPSHRSFLHFHNVISARTLSRTLSPNRSQLINMWSRSHDCRTIFCSRMDFYHDAVN